MFAAAAAAVGWLTPRPVAAVKDQGQEAAEVSVREATVADLPTLLQLEQRLIEDEQPFDAWNKGGVYYNLQDLLTSRKSTVVVAVVATPLAGPAIVATGYCQLRSSKASDTPSPAPAHIMRALAGTPNHNGSRGYHHRRFSLSRVGSKLPLPFNTDVRHSNAS